MTDEFSGGGSHLQELKRLVEEYALRSRELAEAVAALGSLIATNRPTDDAIADIVRLRGLSEEAGTDLISFIRSWQEGYADR